MTLTDGGQMHNSGGGRRQSVMMQSMKDNQEDEIQTYFNDLYSMIAGLPIDSSVMGELIGKVRQLQEEVDDVQHTLSVMDMSLVDARMAVRNVEEKMRASFVTNPGVFDKLYVRGSQLGKGKFGVVHECRAKWKPDEALAVKIIDLSASGEQLLDMQNEVRLLQAVRSPNIVQMVETFADASKFYLVMEKVDGGELLDHLATITYTEAEARSAFRQVISALQVLRHHSIVHRDLKPENLLLTARTADAQIKLADFGLARQIKEGEKLFEGVGSPNFIAPEVLLCLEDESREHEEEPEGYDFAADMWAAGCILFILLFGEPPFYADDHDALYDSIVAGEFKFPEDRKVSREAEDMVSQLLLTDDRLRFNCEQVLEHPWMQAESVGSGQLDGARSSMRSFNSKRRWRSSILAVVATQKIATMTDMKHVALKRAGTHDRASLRLSARPSRNSPQIVRKRASTLEGNQYSQ